MDARGAAWLRRPTISLGITTRAGADRVRLLLELLRPHVDEVVLAVDARDDSGTLELCAELADRRLSFELRDSPAALIGWLLNQCRCDWILRLDDDEVPGVDTLEALGDLVRDRRLTAISFIRRWLYPDRGSYITSAPWRLDNQARLVRNLPGLWNFGGTVHTVGSGPASTRLTDLPLYHADLVLTPCSRRLAKSLDYETEAPALMWNEFPTNGWYLPDRLETLERADVPPRDRELVDRLCGASPASPAVAESPATSVAAGRPGGHGLGTGVGPAVEHAGHADVARYNRKRILPESAFRARLRLVEPPARLPPGALEHCEVLVTNQGTERWPGGDRGEPFIMLGVRWWDGERLVRDLRQPFTEIVDPGETTRVIVALPAPFSEGPHRLEVGVIQHEVRWFADTVSTEVVIGPRPTTAPMWGVAQIDRARAEELAREVKRLRTEVAQLRHRDGASADAVSGPGVR